MDEKICIVVPVYNVEKYVQRCIESIINQSYSNIEVIIVDDGSTDNSLKKCIQYSKNDLRIKVVQKENGGLSDARNFGMRYCTSKLITFIDSDDYVSKDYIKNLYTLMIEYNADIVCTNYISIYEDNIIKERKQKLYKKIYNAENAIKDVLYQKNIANSAWGKLYKREYFKDIEFPKGKLCEDLGTFYKLFEKATVIVYSSIQDYYYLQRKTSIMGSDFNMKKLDALEFANDIYNRYDDKYIKKAARARICAECINLLNKIPKEKHEIRLDIMSILRKHWKAVIADNRVKPKIKIKIIIEIIKFKNRRLLIAIRKD